MATQSLEVIRRVVMEAQSKGFDKLAADLDKVAKSQEGVAGSSTTVTKSQGSVDAAFARTERTLDKTMVAYQAFTRQVKATNDALEQGRTSPERAAQLIGLADAQLQKATGSTAQFAQSTGLARHELINLGRQAQDVVVSLGSGQGLGTVLLQQGAQIGDVFASMRGTVGGALTQLAGMAVRVLPVAAALGAVATALYAVNKAASESREARIATTSGRGRESDIGTEQVSELARMVTSAGVSFGEAKDGVMEFIKVGASAATTYEAMSLAAQLAAAKGIDVAEANKLLAQAMGNASEAGKVLGAGYVRLTDEQQKNVAAMQASGDAAGAAAIVLKSLKENVVSAADATTTWTGIWNTVKSAMSEVLEIYGQIILQETEYQRRMKERRTAPQFQPPPIQADQFGITQDFRSQAQPGLDSSQLSIVGALVTQSREVNAVNAAITAELLRQEEVLKRASAAVGDVKEKLADELLMAQALTAEEKARAAEVVKRHELERAKGADRLPDEAIDEIAKLTGQSVRDKAAVAEAKSIRDATQAMRDQLAVTGAFTTEEKAAAAATQARNQALAAGASAHAANAAAQIAHFQVMETARLEAEKAVRVQQIQIDMYPQLAAAARMQGLEGVGMNAQLQMELQLRQQGLDVMLPENQARIQNAGILAKQAVQLKDIAQATEMLASGMDKVWAYTKETDLLKESAQTRAYELEIIKAEVEARALERQGMLESAEAAREVGKAMASAARDRVIETERIERNRQALQDEAEALRASAQARAAEAQARRQAMMSQGRDPNAMPMHGGTTSGSQWPQFGAGGQGVSMSISDTAAERQGIALFGEGNFSMQTVSGPGMGAPFGGTSFRVIPAGDPKKIADMRRSAQDQLRSGAQQALQSRLGLAMSMLSKHIQDLNETVAKSDELQQKLDQQEDRRQQRIQQYLAAGPSPYEQNADIYYDPKKRLLFAEQIAGSTSDLLKQQVAAAKADEAASKAQIKALEDQQQQLQDHSDLLSAGVDLSQQELTALDMLIGAVRNELPANLAAAFDRMQQAGAQQAKKAQDDLLGGLPIAVKSGLSAPSSYGYTGATYGGVGGLGYGGGSTSTYGGGLASSGGSSKPAALGGFASGGAFTVPGSGAVDRPFRIGLTPGERVTITPPGKRAGGGTTVERMIIQLPPGAEPIQLMNKTSRNSLSRATRRMGRMA